MAYYGILMCSLDPCQLYCGIGIGVVDMGPWGKRSSTLRKNAPRRLLKRLEAPEGKKLKLGEQQ